MSESTSCSWCHTSNDIIPFARNWCRSCGHAADRCRLECDCATCEHGRLNAMRIHGHSHTKPPPNPAPATSPPPLPPGKVRVSGTIECHLVGFTDPSVALVLSANGLELLLTDSERPGVSARIVLTLANLMSFARLVQQAQRGDSSELIALYVEPETGKSP
jgi:hypothetical protein